MSVQHPPATQSEPEVPDLELEEELQAEHGLARSIVIGSSGLSGAEEDAEFHDLLASATHNTVVERVMEVIDRLLEDSQARLFRSVERSEISLEGNRRILEAVLRHDEEAAQRAMAEHLEDIARNL